MTVLRIPLLMLGALLFEGCANWSTVFHDFDLAGGRSVTVDAQQRAILVNRVRDEDGVMRTVYCAEPSPDSLFAIGSSFGASGGANLRSGDKGEIALAQVLASAASDALSTRNATIQLLRDGLYRACEAFAAGALSRLDYAEVTWRYQKMVLAALSIELVSNLNRPRRDVSVTSANGSAGGTNSDAAAPQKGEEKIPQELRAAVNLVTPAAAPKAAAPQPLYSSESIAKISDTATYLVSAVLRSEDRVGQCLRYLSMVTEKNRNIADSRIGQLCAQVIASDLSDPAARVSAPPK